MHQYTGLIADLIIWLGKRSFTGRGIFRHFSLALLEKLVGTSVLTTYKGVPFIFYLDNPTERRAIFGRYNETELFFLLDNLPKDGVFVDVGANSGLYSQFILASAPLGTKVISIEPNPIMVNRLRQNLSLLERIKPDIQSMITIENCAVGAEQKNLYLDLGDGYGSASIVESPNDQTIKVPIERLNDLFKKNKIDKIDALKIDIEGYEDIALIPFFIPENKELFPKAIVIEHTSVDQWGTNVFNVLQSLGYAEVGRTRGNSLLVIGDSAMPIYSR
jgi:FkbM family methyltransferase